MISDWSKMSRAKHVDVNQQKWRGWALSNEVRAKILTSLNLWPASSSASVRAIQKRVRGTQQFAGAADEVEHSRTLHRCIPRSSLDNWVSQKVDEILAI